MMTNGDSVGQVFYLILIQAMDLFFCSPLIFAFLSMPKAEGYWFGVVHLSVLSHNKVHNEGNFMKLILDLYDLGGIMFEKFHQDVSVIEELLPFDCLNFNEFFCSQP